MIIFDETSLSVLWIRIRINLALLVPDPYWECGSRSRNRKMEIDQNLQINLVSCLLKQTFVPSHVSFLTQHLL
jgi:hypothetical protein